MKRIACISMILILNFTALTCFSQNRIRLGKAQTLFFQAEIKGGINYASLGKEDKNRYICESVGVKLKRQIIENNLYFNGGLTIEGNRLANAVKNNEDYSFKFDYTAIGIPLSAEFSCLNNPRFSFYAELGFAPAFCFAGNIEKDGVAQEKNPIFS